MQTLREQGLGEKAVISGYTLTEGESWALLSLQSSRPHWLSRSA